jgi:hypothetical protein
MSELGTCLDSESIGAFADGLLRGEALAVVSEHLLTCDECLSAVGAANRAIAELGNESLGTDELVEPIAFRPRRRPGRWLSAAAAICAVSVIGFWLPLQASVEHRLRRVAALLAGKDRPIGPRITGLPYGEFRNDRGQGDGLPLPLQAAINDVLEGTGTSPVDEQVAGIANLVNNDRNKAIPLLEQSAAEKPRASVYSDLAGARYQSADYARALQSAEAALKIDPEYLPALFNRALILEQLYPAHPAKAIAAWNAYLALDDDSSWASDAKERRDRLKGQP